MHRTVRGISFFFVGIDAAGDLFSIISVCEFLFPTYLELVRGGMEYWLTRCSIRAKD